MLWFPKDEKKSKEEIEKIKKTVIQAKESEETNPEKNETLTEISGAVHTDFPEYTPSPTPSRAPLFVKLEKYDVIVKRIQILDEIIRNTIEVMKINDEIERVKNEVIRTLLRNLQESIKIINFLNRELVRPVPFETEISSYSPEIRRPELESLEEHVTELRKQLEELKKYF